jgi:ferredoxin-NADP reductase
MLAQVGPPPEDAPRLLVCGPTGFVGAVTAALVDLGHDPRRIAAERFGPS